ncbi:GMC oxidoreductase [Jaapia argillacea MUCL 33604]|uniref:GMC oxidoreductase n=1 Tax=Jaapia argillacea MUCL 33604 TaxID=933084 RepID=A0A067PPK5_9AGAM|nr:GMC oxidoreductase [Jaapia argillacea MUCL 33604]
MPLVSLADIQSRTFDFVIAGGGTAGLCLAARLTEDPSVSVLVLEAGNANLNDPNILRMASYASHFGQPEYDWNFRTVPQEFCDGTQFGWNRGKGLGGTSGINFMAWIKPPADDIDDIEKLGNPGWNWERYQRFVHKTEAFTFPTPEVQKKNNISLEGWTYGTEGPLLTAFPAKIISPELDFQQTLVNLGIPVAPAPLDGNPTGVYMCPSTINPLTHTRTYSTTAFYIPNAERPNLSVLVGAYVRKLITESVDGELQATGVEFECDSQICVAKVSKEAIISAGALKSPQILELSGIGDRAVLEKLGIDVKVDLPVGKNVQEHMFVGLSFELRDDVPFDTLDVLSDPKVAATHIELHAAGEGLFTLGLVGFAFMPLSMLSDKADEINNAAKQKMLANASKYPPGLKEQYDVQLDRLERGAPGCEIISFPAAISKPNLTVPGKKYITIIAAMNHCFSRGTIHSTSTDPKADPAMDPHYFEEEIDLHTFVEIIKYIRKIPVTEPFKDIVAGELNPGIEVQTDEQIAAWLKKSMDTTFHTAGSCSMLPRDKGGVVMFNEMLLQVYGTMNIRVVDLSIVPLHFAAHSQATVYSIAEQGKDVSSISCQVTDG